MTTSHRTRRLPKRLQPFALAISALEVATPAEVRYAFVQAVRAFARTPSESNALKVEATTLALSRRSQEGASLRSLAAARRTVPQFSALEP